MITLSLVLLFIGSYALYNTSNKALVSNGVFENWCQQNKKKAQLFAMVLFVFTIILAIRIFGYTSGVLFCLIAFMSLLGIVVIFNPLRVVNCKILLVLCFIILLIEIFI